MRLNEFVAIKKGAMCGIAPKNQLKFLVDIFHENPFKGSKHKGSFLVFSKKPNQGLFLVELGFGSIRSHIFSARYNGRDYKEITKDEDIYHEIDNKVREICGITIQDLVFSIYIEEYQKGLEIARQIFESSNIIKKE